MTTQAMTSEQVKAHLSAQGITYKTMGRTTRL
jgi:hypothetical protein